MMRQHMRSWSVLLWLFVFPLAALLGCADPDAAPVLDDTRRGLSPFDAEFYVSPSGSDANPGTAAQPFATLERARQAVRTVNSEMERDVIVWIRGGTYELAAPLVLGADDSGMNGNKVIYAAYAGEIPVISGGRRITGWTLHDATKGIWRATLPAGLSTRQLYIDGVRAQRARSQGGIQGCDITSTGYTTTQTSALDPRAPRNWQNPAEVEFVYTRAANLPGLRPWNEHRCGVASVGVSTITMDQPCFGSGPNNGCPTSIENVYAELDQPGEWVLSRATNAIYYKPRTYEVMTQVEAIVPVLERLLVIEGYGLWDGNAVRAHDLVIERLTFAHTTWTAPNGGDGFVEHQANLLAVGSADFPPAAVEVRFAERITLSRNVVGHVGGQGIAIDDAARDVDIVGNHVFDASSSGIRVGVDAAFSPPEWEMRRVWVTNNFVHHIGAEYAGGVGIHVMYAADTVVAHNEVGHVPYSAISLGWGWAYLETHGLTSYAGHNEVSDNYLHDYMQVLNDGGGIYTLGPGRSTSGAPRSRISGNYLQNQANDYAGLYLDEGSAYFDVTGNVVSAAPQWLLIWTASIHDNTVTGNFADVAAQTNAGTNNTVSGNTTGLASWPSAAQAIIREAGLEPAYRDVGAPRTGRNLATRATASASSTFSSAHVAGAAIDGRPGTGWAPSSNASPWLLVDLGAPHRLSQIELATRQDLDQPGTRRNLAIWASNNADMSQGHVVLASQGSTPLPFRSTWTLGVGDPTPYRYVAVVKTVSMEHVYVAELRIHGGDRSVALGRPASASTSAAGMPASDATDGRGDTEWQSAPGSSGAWLMVDLGEAHQLRQVQIDLGDDVTGLPEMRRNFEVWASNRTDSADRVVLGAQGATTLGVGATFTTGVQTTTAYRYVTIVKSTGERLGLREVRIFGATPNRAPASVAGASAASAGCEAWRAIDQVLHSGWCPSGAGWWQMNLGAAFVLTGVRVTETLPGTGGTSGTFEVWASPHSDMSLGHTVLARQANVALESPWGAFIPVSDPRPYGYVAIVDVASGVRIGEVEVYRDGPAR